MTTPQEIEDQFRLEPGVTIEQAVSMLWALKALGSAIGVCKSEIEEFLADVLGLGVSEVDGHPVEVKRGAVKTRWDSPRLAHVIGARVADEPADLETGEILPPAALAARVVDTLMGCAGIDTPSFSGWRTTALKALGLDPSSYCEKEGSKVSVILR